MDLGITAALLAIANIILIVLVFSSWQLRIYFQRQYTELKKSELAHFDLHLQSISRILRERTGFTNYVYALERSEEDLSQDIFREIDEYIQLCLDETKRIFEIETGERCATTIKLIVMGDVDLQTGKIDTSIMTFARDQASQSLRASTDMVLPDLSIDEHSPFQAILSGKSHFVSNDLEALSKLGEYKNANENWRKFYNATCVVPIARESVDSKDENTKLEVLGFLCVDSLKANFNPTFSVAMLKIVTHSLYYTFETLTQLTEMYPMEDVPARDQRESES